MSVSFIEGACTPITVQLDQEFEQLENGLTANQKAFFKSMVGLVVAGALAEIKKIEASPISPLGKSLALNHVISELRLSASALRTQSLEDKPTGSDLLRKALTVESLKLHQAPSSALFAPFETRDLVQTAPLLFRDIAFSALNFFVPAAHAAERKQRDPKSSVQREPLCQRPTYSEASLAYGEVEMMGDLQERIGGVAQENFRKGVFINGCTMRISYMANKTGCPVPPMQGQTVSGSGGEQYIYRVPKLIEFLRKAYGEPDCIWEGDVLTKGSNQKLCGSFYLEGVHVKVYPPRTTNTAYGHSYIGNIHFPGSYTAKSYVWILPNPEEKKVDAEFLERD